MNQTIFNKLKLDGTAVVVDELAEPFDVIVPAGRIYERTYQRKRPPAAFSGVAFHEGVAAYELASTDLLALALGGPGSNKDSMVELRGFEPLTPSMPWRCATSCATAPRGLGTDKPGPKGRTLENRTSTVERSYPVAATTST